MPLESHRCTSRGISVLDDESAEDRGVSQSAGAEDGVDVEEVCRDDALLFRR